MVGGVLIAGSIRCPAELRTEPGRGSPTPARRVIATSGEGHRAEFSELTPGISAGLKRQGVQKRPGSHLAGGRDLHTGDHRVFHRSRQVDGYSLQ